MQQSFINNVDQESGSKLSDVIYKRNKFDILNIECFFRLESFIQVISKGKCNNILSAYTMYMYLE